MERREGRYRGPDGVRDERSPLSSAALDELLSYFFSSCFGCLTVQRAHFN